MSDEIVILLKLSVKTRTKVGMKLFYLDKLAWCENRVQIVLENQTIVRKQKQKEGKNANNTNQKTNERNN